MAEGKIQKNPYTFRQGTNDAEFKFGHCTSDGVIDAVLIRSGWFHNHYISLGATGERHRRGGIIARCPGSFQVKAGDTIGGEDNGVYMRTENGNILLAAPNGKIILDASNILLRSSGGPNSSGKVTGDVLIEANNKVLVTGLGDGVTIEGNSSVKIVSEKQVDVIGQSVCNVYGGVLDMADGNATATSDITGKLKSKTGAPKLGGPASALMSSFLGGLVKALIKDNENQQSGGWGSILG